MIGGLKVYAPELSEADCSKKHPCADCHFCQFCSDSRCQACRTSGKSGKQCSAERTGDFDRSIVKE